MSFCKHIVIADNPSGLSRSTSRNYVTIVVAQRKSVLTWLWDIEF